MAQLHPGARWIFRLRFYLAFAGVLVVLMMMGVGALFARGALWFLFLFILFLGVCFILLIGEVYARLSYRFWKYEFLPTNLKVERGIIWKQYSDIPYDRVQNVDIRRGIIARIFGFSELHVQTAGYSAMRRGAFAEGYLPAVSIEEAERIRAFLMKKISQGR